MVPSIHHRDPSRLTIPSTCLETTVHFGAGPSEILIKLKMIRRKWREGALVYSGKLSKTYSMVSINTWVQNAGANEILHEEESHEKYLARLIFPLNTNLLFLVGR